MSGSGRNNLDSTRTVRMQVLSLGMPRTGTVSMQAALETLGCKPTYHGYTSLYNLDHLPLWTAAFEAKYHNNGIPFTREDWDQLLGNYGAVTDAPSICFAEELINAYPETKIVLVERDVETWYPSFEGLMNEYYLLIHRVLQYLDPQLMRVCPKERLLEFDLNEGWDPLCAFLGKEKPDIPFPRLNERGSLAERSKEFQKAGMLNVLRNLGLIVASVGVALFAAGWARR